MNFKKDLITRRLLNPMLVVIGAFALTLFAGWARSISGEKPETAAIQENSLPAWLQTHMEFMTRGDGFWVADNSRYKNENEPYDGYALEWKWGIGKKSIVGRLTGLKAGVETGLFWEYRLIWHPGEKQAVLYQFGGDGTFGSGPLRPGNEGTSELEQTFFSPNGASWKGRHESKDDGDEHLTTSFLFDDGEWQKSRDYVWRRTKKN